MKVLFLDIDGVLLHYRTLMASEFMGHSNAEPDPMLCALLRRVCGTGVRIVMSSSWRDAESACKGKLNEGGLVGFLHADWRTPEFGINQDSRAREIEDWLVRHPETSDYRILDDDDFQWTDTQRAKWYECSPYDGMRAMDMRDLAEWAGVLRRPKSQNQEPTPEP